ncbi:MAG TPA: ABC transporter permease [Candidatus Obscuribacterales bacterium]
MRQLRILGRVFVEMLLGIKQSGWSSWLVVSILAIALTIFGGILQLTMALKSVVSSWGSQLEISVYLKDGYDPRKVAREVSQLPEVKLVEIVPKNVAWEEMQSTFKVAALENPLPDTLHVQLTSADAVEKTASTVRTFAGVEHVRYPLKVARNINQLRHFLEAAGIAVTAALSAATLMVIGNTIQLVIQSRHREIEILSLMGVSPWYIKGPLVLQGAAYGLCSALLSAAFIWGVQLYLESYVLGQLVSFMPVLPTTVESSLTPTLAVLVVLGVAVGAGGSAWTSGRYIKI